MKTLLLLHRCQLTDLFLGIAKEINGRLNIIHVAYSQEEATKLEQNGIKEYYIYSDIVNAQIDNHEINLNTIKEIDQTLIEQTNNRFNLNTAIQSDRGFSILNYQETLLLAQSNYNAWKAIFSNHKIDYLIHEPCSLFFNHVAAVLCKQQGGDFVWQCMTPSETSQIKYLYIIGDNYKCPELEANYNFFFLNSDKIDTERCQKFLSEFRSNYNVAFSNMIMHTNRPKQWIAGVKGKLIRIKNLKRFDRIKQNIGYWITSNDYEYSKYKNLCDYKKHNIRFEDPDPNDSYYYYSFHLEPEAVVLYLGDGIYTNQIKLIENIAAALPAGKMLYVKDHPHETSYRAADDYRRLNTIPNIKLIRSSLSGKTLIKNAIGVFSINGTAGFEALLLGKQVYNLGKSYYSTCPRVNYIHNIRDLKDIIYKNQNAQYTDDTEFMAFTQAYLSSQHVGMVDFFMNRAETYNINLQQNAKQIADDFVEYTKKY